MRHSPAAVFESAIHHAFNWEDSWKMLKKFLNEFIW